MGKNNKLQKLNDAEMNHVKGGGYWDPELGYVSDEVTVYGTYGGCSACNRLNEWQESSRGLTPIGVWLYNTIVTHDVGCPHY